MTLHNGRTIELTEIMRRLLVGAEPQAPGAPSEAPTGTLLLPTGASSASIDGLRRRGLVHRSRINGAWCLTQNGNWARKQLLDRERQQLQALEKAREAARRRKHGPGPRLDGLRADGTAPPCKRPTVDPLTPGGPDRLRQDLERAAESDSAPAEPEPSTVRKRDLVLGLLIFTSLVLIFPTLNTWRFEMLGIPVVCALLCGLALQAPGLGRSRQRRRPPRESYDDPVRCHRNHVVTADALDTTARAMLGRVQWAVDRVLAATPCDEELFLDGARNRVVLAEAEWHIARALRRQSDIRGELAARPRDGERDLEAEQRVRAALEADHTRVEARLRTLEAYARQVDEAERTLLAQAAGGGDRVSRKKAGRSGGRGR